MPTESEILLWIQDWEGPTLDFKDSRILSNANALAKSMVAFTNTLGGTIVIGIRDNRTFEGMTANLRHRTHITNIARNNIDPPLNISFEQISVSGNDVYVVSIPKFDLYPVALKTSGGKVYYIRVNDSIREPSPQEMARLFSGSPENVVSEIRTLRNNVDSIRNILTQFLQRQQPTQQQDDRSHQNIVGLIRAFISRWTGFVNAPTESQIGPNLDEFQFFLRTTSDELGIEVAFGEQTCSSPNIISFANEIRRLGEQQFFIDGGKSWNAFLEKGNELVDTADILIANL
jgi:hypothetical protein